MAIVNCAVINNGVYVSFQIMVFSGCLSRTGIAGLYGSSQSHRKSSVLKVSVLKHAAVLNDADAGGFVTGVEKGMCVSV